MVDRSSCEYFVRLESWQEDMWNNVPQEKKDLIQHLLSDLIDCCDAETSACKDHWSHDDPVHGQCAVFALLFQDYFGGDLLRTDISGLPEYAHMRSHYWNRLPNGIEVDISSNQFDGGNDRKLLPRGEVRTREYLLSNSDTVRRYQMLKERLIQESIAWRK